MSVMIGKKVHMTEMYRDDGTRVPVTVLSAGPCVVVGARTVERDGYQAMILGYGFRKKISKPMAGALKNLGQFRVMKEFRHLPASGDMPATGSSLGLETFTVGDEVSVVGQSKGKGFQGVVKRHGFHGHPTTHGHKDQTRMPGSSGAGGVQRVFPGKRMPGRMGDDRVTVHGLTVVKVDAERHELWVSGAVPGARGSIVLITSKK